jgi:hypothetical protein
LLKDGRRVRGVERASERLEVRTYGLVVEGGAGCYLGAAGLWVGRCIAPSHGD